MRTPLPDVEGDTEIVSEFGPLTDNRENKIPYDSAVPAHLRIKSIPKMPIDNPPGEAEVLLPYLRRQESEVAPRPKMRDPLPTDCFRVLRWPPVAHSLGAYKKRLEESRMPLPETLERSQLLGLGVDILTAVRTGIVEPLSEGNPERPYLTPDGFSQAFMGKYTNDAVGRLTALFAFLRKPESHPLHWEIPGPKVPAEYKAALVNRVKLSPACLRALLEELEKSHTETQETAFQMLAKEPEAFIGKAAQPHLQFLLHMMRKDWWHADTLRVFLKLLQAVCNKPDYETFAVIRRLQSHKDGAVNGEALRAEYALFVEPNL